MNVVKQKQTNDLRHIQIHTDKSSNNKTKRYIRKQRACGIVLLIVAILSAVISQDSTAAVILIPLALYMIITRKHVMCF